MSSVASQSINCPQKSDDIPSFNLRLVVALNFLRTKVLQAHRSVDGGSDHVQVGRESDRLKKERKTIR